MTFDVYFDLVAMIVYSLALIFLLFVVFMDKKNFIRPCNIFLYGGLLLNSIGLILRWEHTGHAPANIFEASVLAAWIGVVVFLIVVRLYPKTYNLGLVVLPMVLLQFGYGMTFLTNYEPLKPEYQSIWLTIHIIFAFLATGCYLVAFAGGILDIFKVRGLLKFSVLEDFNVKLVSIGFVAHFLMIGTGAIWAQEAWGNYWGWDPIETWSLITWLVYGLYLHFYYTLGLRGKKMVWMMIGCFCLVIFCYWMIPHIPIENFSELYD